MPSLIVIDHAYLLDIVENDDEKCNNEEFKTKVINLFAIRLLYVFLLQSKRGGLGMTFSYTFLFVLIIVNLVLYLRKAYESLSIIAHLHVF